MEKSVKSIAILGIISLIIGASGLGVGLFSIVTGGAGADGEDGIVDYTLFKTYYCSNESEIQDAITAIGSNSGTIILTDDMTISNDIMFDGGGQFVFQGAGHTLNLYDRGHVSVNTVEYCLIENLKLVEVNAWIQLLMVVNPDDRPVYLENIEVIGNASRTNDGIRVDSENVWVSNCYLESLSTGILVYSNYSHILNNRIKNCTWRGISNHGSYNKLSGNTIEYIGHSGPGGYGRGIWSNGDYNFISKNFIRNVTGNLGSGVGIEITFDTVELIGRFTTISENIILDVQRAGIESSYSDRNIISNNIISNVYYNYTNHVAGIFLYSAFGGPHYCDQNTVVGNQIYSCNNPDSIGVGYGIKIDTGGQDNTIVGNYMFANDVNLQDDGTSTLLSGNHYT